LFRGSNLPERFGGVRRVKEESEASAIPSRASAAAGAPPAAAKARAMRAAPSRIAIAALTARRSLTGFKRDAGRRVPALAT